MVPSAAGLSHTLRNFRLLFVALALASWIIIFVWPLSPQSSGLSTSRDEAFCPSLATPSETVCDTVEPMPILPPVLDEFAPEHWVLGNKTSSFRDNLRKDAHYITSGSSGGFTNLFIGFTNMIYLASVTGRVPLIPPLLPSQHIPDGTEAIPFGDIFDVPALRQALRMPILEWRDVKHYFPNGTQNESSLPPPDKLGCWAASPQDFIPSFQGNILNLDISYTHTTQDFRNANRHSLIFALASLIYPNHERGDGATLWLPGSKSGHTEAPDRHLACFDDLYFSTTNPSIEFEWFWDYSPQWRAVQRHVKFTQEMTDIAQEYIRTLLRIDENSQFIGIHIRHGNFGGSCQPDSGRPLDCFAPLSAWASLVNEVKRELLEKKSLDVRNVIVASDETDPLFWEEVSNMGWFALDHKLLGTMERFGNEWIPPILDTIILSMGVGFVGTSGSTFSLLAKRRVQDWNLGFTRERGTLRD